MSKYTHMRMGRLKPTHAIHAVPRLRLVTAKLGTPPAAISWATNITGLDVLGNDEVGDCAVVAPAQLARVATAAAGHERVPKLDAVLQSYADVSGWKKDDPSTDRGCVMTDVLSRWKSPGLKFFDDGPLDQIEGYVALNPRDINEVKWAIAWFGSALFGHTLPVACQDDLATWDVPPPGPKQAIWGGHCTAASSYGPEGIHTITWGKFINTTEAFVRTYCEEAYAVILRDWELPNGLTPAGTNRAQMQDEIRQLARAAAASGTS